MGAGPASQEFHEKFRLSLQGLLGVIQIQDDILIHAKSQENHRSHLHCLLEILSTLGITLSKEKCKFDLSEITWFGFVFNEKGMKPNPKKVEAINQKDIPQMAEVKSFLRMCQYNQTFMFGTTETYQQRIWEAEESFG